MPTVFEQVARLSISAPIKPIKAYHDVRSLFTDHRLTVYYDDIVIRRWVISDAAGRIRAVPPLITKQKTGYSVEWLKKLSSAAGFAISSDNPKLLARLNDAALQIDTPSIYKDYVDQFDWPDKGFISAGKLKLPERE